MNTDVEERLSSYFFPVKESRVFFETDDVTTLCTPEYKAITRADNGRLISVMNDTYELVPNSEIIKPLMEQLHNLDSKWIIDPSHSYVEDHRMRLQVTFPDLTFNDGKSDIALSLFLHNSYDGSEGIRMFWGAIRGICSNGMVFGKVLGKYYRKHTSGVRLDNLVEQVRQTYDQLPVIKERIDILQNIGVSKTLQESVEKQLGKSIVKYIEEQPTPESQWILYNYLTWYISHKIDQRMRAAYQLKVSKLFGL